MARRTSFLRNPVSAIGKSKMLPYAVAGAGLYLLYKAHNDAPHAPVNGLSGLGFSIGRAIKSATQSITRVADKRALKVPLAIATGGGSIITKQGLTQSSKAISSFDNRVLRVNKASPTPAPAAGQQIVYQDSNGNAITKAQYDALMAQYAAAQQTQAYNSPPIYNQAAASGPAISYTDPSAVYGGGGGGGGADAYQQQYAPSADAQAPDQAMAPGGSDPTPAAEGKVHPLVVAGAVIGVPVLMSFLGGK